MIDGEDFRDHIKLFMSIASTFVMSSEKHSEAFNKINRTFGGLVTLIIQKLDSIVSSSVQRNKNKQTSKVMDELKMLYTESLNVIKFIVERSKIELSNYEIEALFRIYVEESEYPEHGQDILYNFFMKKRINGITILNYQNKRFLFENILCSLTKINHSHLTLKAFHCFSYLFLYINMDEDLLVFDKISISKLFKFDDSEGGSTETSVNIRKNIGNLIEEVKSFGLLGLESLWRVISTTQYEDVLFQCEVFLSSIYYKLNIQHFNDVLIYETFFEKVIMLMNQKESVASNLLHLLITF